MGARGLAGFGHIKGRFALLLACALVGSLVFASAAFAAATWTNQTPAVGGSTQSVRPLITVDAYEPGTISGSPYFSLKVDGVTQLPTLTYLTSDKKNARLSFTPRADLAQGTHTVWASVRNSAGTYSTTTWTFKVAAGPKLANLAPAPNSAASTDAPTISASVTGATTGLVPSVLVDGRAVAATFNSGTGVVSAPLTKHLVNASSHDVTMTVTNSAGVSDTLAWKFSIQIYQPMPVSNCLDCHTAYPSSHSTSNCAACHGSDSPVGGGYSIPAESAHIPGANCGNCHNITLADCLACHSGGFSTVPNHQRTQTQAHTTDACQPCHVNDLTTEHNRYGSVTCTTCHNSTDARVKAAITQRKTDCASCHTIPTDHPYAQVNHVANVALVIDAESGLTCGDCHDMDMSTEHGKPSSSSFGAGCTNCHPSPRDSFEGWDYGCSQGTCHANGTSAEPHAKETASHALPAVATGCVTSGCHTGATLSALHSNASTVTAGGTTLTGCKVCHSKNSVPATNDCTVCHSDKVSGHGFSTSKHTATPAAQTITISGVDFTGVACSSCHALELKTEHSKTTSSSSANASVCTACHPTPRSTFATWDKTTCSQGGCHASGSSSAQHANIDAAHQALGTNSSCFGADCHSGSLASLHKTASYTNTGGATLTSCQICHEGGSIPSTKDCSACHSGHGDLTAKHTATLGTATITIKGNDYDEQACSSCHASASLTTIHTSGCATCHPTPKSTLAGGWDKSCAQGGCHTASSTKPMHGQVDADHTVAANACTAAGCHEGEGDLAVIHAGTCADCHAAGKTPSKVCADCHNTDAPHGDVSTTHQSSISAADFTISGVDLGSVACATCHTQSNLLGAHDNTCATCHPNPRNSITTWNKTCADGECHTPGSAALMHANLDSAHAKSSANDACFASGCHASIADASLAAIHSLATTTVAGETRTSCTICHNGAPLTRDCLSCHPERAASHGYDVAKHTATPASQDITINGETFSGLACADCHSLELKPLHAGTAANTCSACHATLVPALNGWDKGCAQGGCHTAGSSKPMHANVDASHARGAASDGCFAAGCHTDASAAKIHEKASKTVDGKTLASCQICHSAGVTNADDCSTCHNLSSPHADLSAEHTATLGSEPISFGGKDYGTHACSECHQSSSLTDIHNNQCATCHPSPKDSLDPTWQKGCAQGACHTSGTSKPMHNNIVVDHTVARNTCSTIGCHYENGTSAAALHANASTVVGGQTRTSCQICHAPGVTPTTDCVACHDLGAPHVDTTVAHSAAPVDCQGANCHGTNCDVSVLHTTEGCQTCHGTPGLSPTTECATCHTNAGYAHGYTAANHTGETSGTVTLLGKSYDVQCAACHNAATGEMDLKPVHVAVGKGACTQCHPSIVPDTFSSWNRTCAQVGCHSVSDARPEHQNIEKAHEMVPVAKDCLTGGKCHVGSTLPEIHQNASVTIAGETYSGCQVCHKNSVAAPVVPDFTDPNGSVWSNECLGCHPDRWEQHGYNAAWHTSDITTGSVTVGTFTQDVTCTDCHDATLMSTNASGTVTHEKTTSSLWTGELVCDNCHPSPRDQFTEWNKGCQQANCHTGTSTSPMHNEIESRHGITEASKSCVIDGCHLGDTIAPGWGDNLPQIHKSATATVDGKTVTSCMVCHFNNEYRPNSPTDAPTFQTDALGVPNTADCGVCHPQGQNVMHAYSFVNHTASNLTSATITIGSTTWPEMACTRCHYNELSSEHARNISGFKSKGCANCHPTPYDTLEAEGQAIGGWSKTCVQAGCHVVGTKNEMHRSVTASHTPLPENASCMTGSECHPSGATLADLHSKATTVVAGQTRTSCDVCHGDFKTQSQPPTQDCTYCHKDKVSGGQVVDHVDVNTLHPTTSAAGCYGDASSCHSKYLAKEHFRWTPAAGGTFTCKTCHDSTDTKVKAAISSGDTSCEACHTTHHGTQTPASNTSCLDCHGASSTEVSTISTAGAYANMAGDHSGFTASAHNSIQTTPTLGDQDTNIQCTVCHSHDRAIDKKVEYRYTGWPAADQNHEDLCFQCHTAQVTFVNEPNKPNTWNGRSVQADFQRYSKHTISTGKGSYVDQEVPTALNDTTLSQFQTEILSQLQVAAGPVVKLAQDPSGGVNPAAQTGLMFANRGGTTTYGQYKTTDNAWDSANSAAFTPAVAPGTAATGASSFRIPGDRRVFLATGSTAYVYSPPADPTADSWTTNTNFAAGASLGAGGDTAVDTTGTATTGLCVYYLRGGSGNYIYYKPFAGSATAAYGRIQYPSGTTLNQGAGSALAFAPTSNRVFVINRNGTSGDGRLYYYTGFNRPANASLVFTQGPSITTSSTTTVYNRLTAATIGGADYLFSFGTSSANQITLQVVTNVATTPAILGTGIKAPAGWTALGDGLDLKYNSNDGYLYAIRGGGNAGVARIKVPASPGVASSWTGVSWEVLTGTQTWAAGSSIEFADADPLLTTPFKYYAAGTMTTASDVSPVTGSIHWGQLSWNSVVPAGTSLTMKVEGYNGSTWSTLANGVATAPIDLSNYTTTAITKMRVTATFSTTTISDANATPQLTSLTLTSVKQSYVPPSGSMIQCENCHNTHLAQMGSGPWSMARVSNPLNTKQVWSGTPTDFCLTCHSGATAQPTGLTPTISATTLIPYSVAFRSVTSPFFPGFSKTVTGLEFKTSGHWTTSGSKAGCENCHDPHGSDNPELTAYTPSSGATVANSRQNSAAAGREENLCIQCHGATAAAVNGRSMIVTMSVGATYGHNTAAYSLKHSNEETMGSFGIAASRHVECADCHNPHESQAGTHTPNASAGGLAIRGAFGVVPPAASNWATPTAASYTTIQLTATQGTEANLCFKCHAGPGANPNAVVTRSDNSTYAPTDLGREFNPSNFSFHNVTGQATGMKTSFTYTDSGGTSRTQTFAQPTIMFKSGWTSNSKMTCSECHTAGTTAQAKGPHGSSVKFMIDPNYAMDWKTGYLASTGSAANAGFGTAGTTPATSIICQKCHVLYTTAWGNGGHSGNSSHRGTSRPCVACHIAIPHGWKRPRMLVNAAVDKAPYLAAGRTTSNSFSGFLSTTNHTLSGSTVSWSQNDCQGCGQHGAKTPYMP